MRMKCRVCEPSAAHRFVGEREAMKRENGNDLGREAKATKAVLCRLMPQKYAPPRHAASMPERGRPIVGVS
jgi:hypothetical protein